MKIVQFYVKIMYRLINKDGTVTNETSYLREIGLSRNEIYAYCTNDLYRVVYDNEYGSQQSLKDIRIRIGKQNKTNVTTTLCVDGKLVNVYITDCTAAKRIVGSKPKTKKPSNRRNKRE